MPIVAVALPEADEELSLSQACELLATDPSARAAFPGARDHLCGGKPATDAACRQRGHKDCVTDSVCSRLYGPSNCDFGDRGPCLPDYVYKRCTLVSKPELATLVRQFRICIRSGGTWEASGLPEDQARRYGRVCSCMGSSPDAVLFSLGYFGWKPDRPVVLYVAERGCVPEQALCKEHGGRWVSTAPVVNSAVLLQEADCLKISGASWKLNPETAYGTCGIDSIPMRMDTLSERDCKARGGISWKPLPNPFGLCTYEDKNHPYTLNFAPFCEVDGTHADWKKLDRRVGFPY